MTYKDDETREAFHLLPTEEQITWLGVENSLMGQSYTLHIENVSQLEGRLKVEVQAVRDLVTDLPLALSS